MPRKNDEMIKGWMNQIGGMIDARHKTLEVILMGEIRASEGRIRKDMATKDDIKNMATKDDIKDMATKSDIARLEKKLDETRDLRKQLDELKKRLDQVEMDLQRVRARN
jgi:hypothetical protein